MRTTMECDFSIFICIELPNELMYSNGKKKNKQTTRYWYEIAKAESDHK